MSLPDNLTKVSCQQPVTRKKKKVFSRADPGRYYRQREYFIYVFQDREIESLKADIYVLVTFGNVYTYITDTPSALLSF